MYILLGEGGLIYILAVLFKFFTKYRKSSVIYSSYSPFADHFIAYVIKLFRPKIYWIADFRDLHIDPDDDTVLFKKFNKWIDAKIFKRANVITTVSEGLREQLLQFNENVYVLRNGISSEMIKKFDKVQTQRDISKFTLTYTGKLYEGRRDPSRIFQAISNLIDKRLIVKEELELAYAGKDGYLWKQLAETYNLGERVKDYGYVSLEESVRLQKNSNVNILLSWATKNLKGILTGKFYEYLIASRPICLAISGENDPEFEKIFSELENCTMVYNKLEDLSALEDYILNLYTSHKAGTESTNLKFSKYNWEVIFNEFYNTNLTLA